MRFLIVTALACACAFGQHISEGQVERGVADFSAATSLRVKTGTAAPSSGDCDASGEVGRFYLRSENPATANSQLYTCGQVGASSYAWLNSSFIAQNDPPTTCAAGQAWFDTNATAGSNWFGCTSANTWTLMSGGGTGTPALGTITRSSSTVVAVTAGTIRFNSTQAITGASATITQANTKTGYLYLWWDYLGTLRCGYDGTVTYADLSGCGADGGAISSSTFPLGVIPLGSVYINAGSIASSGAIVDLRAFLNGATAPIAGANMYIVPTAAGYEFSSLAMPVAVGSASTSAQTATITGYTAYATNTPVWWVPGSACSGAMTLNINGLGAKSVKQSDGSTNPVSGQCNAGSGVPLNYNGTLFTLPPGSGGTTYTATAPVDVTGSVISCPTCARVLKTNAAQTARTTTGTVFSLPAIAAGTLAMGDAINCETFWDRTGTNGNFTLEMYANGSGTYLSTTNAYAYTTGVTAGFTLYFYVQVLSDTSLGGYLNSGINHTHYDSAWATKTVSSLAANALTLSVELTAVTAGDTATLRRAVCTHYPRNN